jgi:RimJ/RimL family protein N-acetyltransferase
MGPDVRPLTSGDQPQVDALLARALRPAAPAGGAWTATPSGDVHHLLGLWRAGELVAAARLVGGARTRLRHVCDLTLAAAPGEDAGALWRAVVSFVDQWTPFDRIQLDLPADEVTLDAGREVGFEVEVRRRARLADGRDELALGRLRPGWSPRAPGAPPPWPTRRPPSADVSLRLRPIAEGDEVAVHGLSVEPTSVWGTFQTPTATPEFYAARFHNTPPGHVVSLVEVDGVPAGLCGLHPTAHAGVVVIGMAISVHHQGCGLGRRVLDLLIEAALARGDRRIELGVFETNTRARALYERVGFVVEGLRRADGIQAGGHTNSVEMALFADR